MLLVYEDLNYVQVHFGRSLCGLVYALVYEDLGYVHVPFGRSLCGLVYALVYEDQDLCVV